MNEGRNEGWMDGKQVMNEESKEGRKHGRAIVETDLKTESN